MPKNILLLFYLFYITSVAAQKGYMKWGVIPKEDFEMKVYDKDSSANVVILGDYASLDVGYYGYTFYHHQRIKFFNRAGFDKGDFKIPYYATDNIDNIKAVVYAPDGFETVLTKDKIFTEKINAYWSSANFALPNIQEGSIAEIQYEINSSNIFTLRTWDFQKEIAVRHSELKLIVPENMIYVYLLEAAQSFQKTTKRIADIDSYKEETVLIGESLPALREEPYMTTLDDYRSSLRFQLKSIQRPGAAFTPIFSDWKTLATEVAGFNSIGMQITQKGKSNKVWNQLEPLLPQNASNDEKIRIIYDFLNEHLVWNEQFSDEASKDLDEIFESKTGSSGELNLLMIALLNRAGIPAYPVFVSTRSHGKPVEIYPIISQFNHIITYIENGDKPILADVGYKWRPLNTLRIESLNGRGWLLKKGAPEWIDIERVISSQVMSGALVLGEDGSAIGSLNNSYRGYDAVNKRENFDPKAQDEFILEEMSEQMPEISIDSFSIEEAENADKPFREYVKFSLPNAAVVAGDYIYFTPFLWGNLSENPFKTEIRNFPVNMPYPRHDQYILNLAIPEGYAIEELPEPISLSLPNNGGKFLYQLNHTENTVQLVCKVNLDQTYFEVGEYPLLRAFFGSIIEKQGEQVVLKRK